MAWLAGVDGCRGGWFRASRNGATGAVAFDHIEHAADLLRKPPVPEIVAIDIPIGLPEAGSRACDLAARARLGPARGRSVFPAPIRAALGASDYAEACETTRRADGRRVSRQAWNLFPKIREVDRLLAEHPAARAAFREVHPELSFLVWNGGEPMAFAKKRPQGRTERLRLVESWLGPDLLARARGGEPRRWLADDDIVDAAAALYTAHRIAAGEAETLPAEPVLDAAGLPMEIVF